MLAVGARASSVTGTARVLSRGSVRRLPSTCPTSAVGGVTGLIEVSWALGLLIGVSTMGLVTARARTGRIGYASRAAADRS